MSIAYVVQSVPSRRKIRQRLLENLPPAVVVEDDGPPPGNPWRGYQLCLNKLVLSDSSHGLIVQDDAIVCQNFAPALELLADLHPSNPIVLFYPGLPMKSARNMRNALQRKRTMFVLNRQDFLPVVAVLWPCEKARFLLEWSVNVKIPGLRSPYRSDDAVIGYWMRRTRQDVFVTMPSLVEHPDDVDPVKDGPHEAKHGRDRGRVALSFCKGDPLEIEWSV